VEGAVLMSLYIGYVVVLVVASSGSASQDLVRTLYVWGMWPVAVVTMLLLLWRSNRNAPA